MKNYSNKMGKGVTSLLKVSKSIEKKPHLDSLINVLKPKVYITDSSSFRGLVQDLTGNGSSCSSSSSSTSSSSSCYCLSDPSLSPPPLEPAIENLAAPVTDVYEHGSFSTDDLPSFDSLQQHYLDNQTYSDTLDESSNLVWEPNLSFIAMDQSENLYLENQLPVADTEWSAYQDLESWLLDTDQQPLQPLQYLNGDNFNRKIGTHEQEVTAFNLDDICGWLL